MTTPRTFGRYEVIDLIAEGGVGDLYRARDPLIGRYVAIKLLKHGYDTEEFRERFSREARAAGILSHPHIVTIYDVGAVDGRPFIAMEYVRGETFADLVRLRPPLPLARKLQLTEEVCAGLAHAHEAGIVHRDIKPANLVVGAEGTVKILDFGIAKFNTSSITAPGAIVGTPSYMAPEQLRGNPVDARADIFSLGAVLYELVSHQPAFPGSRYQDVAGLILNARPTPISEFCPDLDARLVDLIDSLLEKDPDERANDIGAVRQTLLDIRLHRFDGRPTPAAGGASRRSTPPPVRRGSDEDAGMAAAVPPSRERQVADFLASAASLTDAGDYDAALDACKQVLLLDASEDRAITLIARIHAVRDRTQADAELAEARSRLAGGELTLAREALDVAVQFAADHPAIIEVSDAIAAAEAARSREAAIASAWSGARADFAAARWDAALQSLTALLTLVPEHAGALALRTEAEAKLAAAREEARLRTLVAGAEELFVRGEQQSAIQQLEALGSGAPGFAADALESLRRRWAAIEAERRLAAEHAERERQAAALFGEAAAATADARFADARTAIARLRSVDAKHPNVARAEQQLADAEAEAARRAELASTVAAVEAALDAEDLDAAADRLRDAVGLGASAPQLKSLRQRAADVAAAKAAREAAAAQRREADEAVDDAERRLDNGDVASVADLIERIMALVPDHPRVAELSTRLTAVLEQRAAAERAERLRQEVAAFVATATTRADREPQNPTALTAALRDVKEALALAPDHEEAQALRTRLETALADLKEAARVNAAVDNARRRFANGKHAAAIQLLEDLTPGAAMRPTVATALDEMRAERDRIERTRRLAIAVEQTQTAIAAEDHDGADRLIDAAASIDGSCPELSELREQNRRSRQAAAQRETLRRHLADFDEALRADDVAASGEHLALALAVDAAAPKVLAAQAQLDARLAEQAAAAARAQHCVEQTAAAEIQLATGDIDGAVALLEEVVSVDPGHVGAIDALARARAAQDARHAEEAAAAERQLVEDLIAAAVQQVEAVPPDVHRAARAVAKVLERAPADPRGLDLKRRVDVAIAAEHEAAAVRAGIRNARSRFANGKHQAALQLLESLDPGAHPDVDATLLELRAALEQIRAAELARASDTPPHADAAATVFVPSRVAEASPDRDDNAARMFGDASADATGSHSFTTLPMPALVGGGAVLLFVIVAVAVRC